MPKMALVECEKGTDMMRIAVFDGGKKLEDVTFSANLKPAEVEAMRGNHEAFLDTVEDCRDKKGGGMRSAKIPLVAVVIGMLASACSQQEQFPVVNADGQIQTPAAAQQAPIAAQQDADSGVSDMLLGGAVGYMLGSMGDSGRERVVERHYYSPPKTVSKPAPKPIYKPAPAKRSFNYKPSRSSSRRR